MNNWIKQHSELYQSFLENDNNIDNIIVPNEFLLDNLTVSNDADFVKVLKCLQYWLCKYNEEIICYACNHNVAHLYDEFGLSKDALYKLYDRMIHYKCNFGIEGVKEYLIKNENIKIKYFDENNKIKIIHKNLIYNIHETYLIFDDQLSLNNIPNFITHLTFGWSFNRQLLSNCIPNSE